MQSRFVMEKKLDAGDIVSFQGGVGDLAKDCLFINWRTTPTPSTSSPLPPSPTTSPSAHPWSFCTLISLIRFDNFFSEAIG